MVLECTHPMQGRSVGTKAAEVWLTVSPNVEVPIILRGRTDTTPVQAAIANTSHMGLLGLRDAACHSRPWAQGADNLWWQPGTTDRTSDSEQQPSDKWRTGGDDATSLEDHVWHVNLWWETSEIDYSICQGVWHRCRRVQSGSSDQMPTVKGIRNLKEGWLGQSSLSCACGMRWRKQSLSEEDLTYRQEQE